MQVHYLDLPIHMEDPVVHTNERNMPHWASEVGVVCSSKQQLTSQLACLVPSVWGCWKEWRRMGVGRRDWVRERKGGREKEGTPSLYYPCRSRRPPHRLANSLSLWFQVWDKLSEGGELCSKGTFQNSVCELIYTLTCMYTNYHLPYCALSHVSHHIYH